MTYGPIGAFLAEFFPSRIRYTSVSVPYHIGNGWGGGLVPFITTAAFQATGSLGYAHTYPISVPAVCFVLAMFLMPETRHISIWEPEEARQRHDTQGFVRGPGPGPAQTSHPHRFSPPVSPCHSRDCWTAPPASAPPGASEALLQ